MKIWFLQEMIGFWVVVPNDTVGVLPSRLLRAPSWLGHYRQKADGIWLMTLIREVATIMQELGKMGQNLCHHHHHQHHHPGDRQYDRTGNEDWIWKWRSIAGLRTPHDTIICHCCTEYRHWHLILWPKKNHDTFLVERGMGILTCACFTRLKIIYNSQIKTDSYRNRQGSDDIIKKNQQLGKSRACSWNASTLRIQPSFSSIWRVSDLQSKSFLPTEPSAGCTQDSFQNSCSGGDPARNGLF